VLTPSTSSQEHTQIAHYRLRRPIGGGAMANVYEAEDVRSGELVALKVLQEHVNTTSEAVARFIREGRALQKLRHANIVRVLDQGVTEGGDAWIALERLQGVSLDALIRDEGRLSPPRAMRFVQDIAKALALVHSRGLIHRDIKPENVFVVLPDTPREHAKLIDFGIARVSMEELGENSVFYTRADAMLGTAAFAAPEQMLGRKDEVGPSADVFSLGVTAYEMLTGALPFAGDTIKDQLKSKVAGRVVPIASRLRDPASTHPSFAALVESCLAVNPAERPKDGLALLGKIAACIEGGEAGTPRAPMPTPAASDRASGRLPVWVLLLIALAAGGLVMGAGLLLSR
jgi:serine/threonine-protein kinase